MKSYFRHFRFYDTNGRILPRGGVTLLVTEQWFDYYVNVTVTNALCSLKDHYNKRIGRKVASDRTNSPRYTSTHTVKHESEGEVRSYLFQVADASLNGKCRTMLKRGARLALSVSRKRKNEPQVT